MEKNAVPKKSNPLAKSARWLRDHLFFDLTNSVLSLSAIGTCLWVLAIVVEWSILHSVVQADSVQSCREIIAAAHRAEARGACWAVLSDHSGNFAFGFYPTDLLWHPALAIALLPAALAPFILGSKFRGLLLFSGLYPLIAYTLIWGGAGLEPVDSSRIGGFLLTLVIAVTASVLAFPLGIAVALGRQYAILPIRALFAAGIELGRAIPTFVVLFLGAFLMTYTLPPGTSVDLILRCSLLLAFPASIRIAEAVRQALVSTPPGQREAALALGFSQARAFRRLLLPQAIHRAAPQIWLIFAGLLRDTTLILVLGLLDPLALIGAVLADEAWHGATLEVFAAVGILYWLFGLAITRFARHLVMRSDARGEPPILLNPPS